MTNEINKWPFGAIFVCGPRRRAQASLASLIRLPYLKLIHCFYYNQDFYTPEKPSWHRAFRVSTYS